MPKEITNLLQVVENPNLVRARELLKTVSEQTGIQGFIKGGYIRDFVYNNLHGTNNTSKDLDVSLANGVNLFVEKLVHNGGRIRLLRYRKKTPVFEVCLGNEQNSLIVDIGILIAEPQVYQREQNMFVYELVRQDALHSDFTINSLYLPLTTPLDFKNIVDPLGGIEDVRRRVVKMVSPYIFWSSPVCMLRAIRLIDTLGATLEEETKEAIKHYAPFLNKSVPVVVQDNLEKIFASPNRETNIILLKELGLYEYIPKGYLDVDDSPAR